MANQQFILTVRRDDILEIYSDEVKFVPFSENNSTKTQMVILFSIFTAITSFVAFQDKGFMFLPILFSLALLFNAIPLIKTYISLLKKRKLVNTWIDSFQQYKTHTLTIIESGFSYKRDEEKYTYKIDNSVKIIFTDSYFHITLSNGDNLLIPEKSFAPNQFIKFIEIIEEIKSTN